MDRSAEERRSELSGRTVACFHRSSHGIEKHEALTVTSASGSSINPRNKRGEERSLSLTQARSLLPQKGVFEWLRRRRDSEAVVKEFAASE
jgi:hypothetical protein